MVACIYVLHRGIETCFEVQDRSTICYLGINEVVLKILGCARLPKHFLSTVLFVNYVYKTYLSRVSFRKYGQCKIGSKYQVNAGTGLHTIHSCPYHYSKRN